MCILSMYSALCIKNVKIIQMSKFEDLIGCIQQYVNREASHPARGRELLGVFRMEGFCRNGVGQGS